MSDRLVFVSCGQETNEEIDLGKEVKRRIERPGTGMIAFFAQEVHSPVDLNSEVFRTLRRCDGFFAVLHKRGIVRYLSYPETSRSSVWIQQEIAVIAYRQFLQGRAIPSRVYMEEGILREGLMRTTIMNPIAFRHSSEVLAGLDSWLSGPEWRPDPILDRREGLYKFRASALASHDWLLLEIVMAHSAEPGAATYGFEVRSDFIAALGLSHDDPSGHPAWKKARSNLRAAGFLRESEDKVGGYSRLSVTRQWWDLIADQLRSAGRLLPP